MYPRWLPILHNHKEHNLIVGSLLFPHKKIHKLTWNSPNGRTENQIGTLINRNWRNSLKDVRVYRRADVGIDHNLAITTIHVIYDTSKLLESDVLTCFHAKIGGKFHALAELDANTDVDEEWNVIVDTVNRASVEHLGFRMKMKADWISTETKELIERKVVKPAMDSDSRELNRHTRIA
ncbi:uncharacterized protein [Amphiura filiformis]|uniref:uncharacterized protein n=1 Tax=Amphiura filiformis TaxID=82378 RepID=UPI003B21B61D